MTFEDARVLVDTSTDLRGQALRFGVDRVDAVLFTQNGVDGVYSADPKKDPAATRFDTLTYDEAISRDLKVVDQTAFTLAAENKLPMVVIGLEPEGNILRAARGEKIGTLVSAG